MADVEIKGWTRTALLGVGACVGALAGVLGAAGLIHIAKQQGWIK